MKQLQLPFTLGIFLLLSVSSAIGSRVAFADNITYWGNSSGEVWMSGFAECWQGANGISSPECGGVMEAPEPEPMMAAAPNLDDDGDGVPNSEDICWTTPAGDRVDLYGCTIIIPEPEMIASLQGVHFDSDSAMLTSEAKSILDGVVSTIKASSSSQIDVEGHTDSRLSDSYNQALSERRAQSVVDYLISNGVSASILNPVGMGESSPVASNDTREGRAQNRRVEIIAR